MKFLKLVPAYRFHIKLFWTVMALMAMVCGPKLLYAGWTITQTIQLKAGWNAVFLEAKPADPKPDTVFKDTPVDKVLTYFPQTSSVQFIQNPEEIPYNKAGWHFWVPKTKPESFLNNLFILQANQPYLIRCTQDFQWTLTGTPKIRSVAWQPNSFNFAGFHVNASNPPAFNSYFSGLKAYPVTNIFYLNNGVWIRGKSTDPIVDGQAYWLFCNVADYETPLAVKLPAPGDSLTFSEGVSELRITITNKSDSPVGFTLEQIPNPSGNELVPLSLVQSDPVAGKSFSTFTTYSPQSYLESGKEAIIRLAARQSEIVADQATSLLKLTDNFGGRVYIPVSAQKAK